VYEEGAGFFELLELEFESTTKIASGIGDPPLCHCLDLPPNGEVCIAEHPNTLWDTQLKCSSSAFSYGAYLPNKGIIIYLHVHNGAQ
jgi:hypothetical protein